MDTPGVSPISVRDRACFNYLSRPAVQRIPKSIQFQFSITSRKQIKMSAAAEEYHSKDFDWETLKQEIEGDPSLRYHLQPFNFPQPESSKQPESINAWQRFHIQHSSGKFFKERRYLLKEFPELVSCGEGCRVLEVGCGNGSTALPILRGNKNITLYACDCSNETLERAKEYIAASNIVSVDHRFHPFYCDFATTGFPNWLACNTCSKKFSLNEQNCYADVQDYCQTQANDLCSTKENSCCIGGVDFISLIFTLSAVPLQRMPMAIKECFSVLKPGGLLLFRDYGLYDMTMLRFEPDQRVGFREYMRTDGTRSYFFCLDTVRDVFAGAGFIELEIEYCCVKSVNRRNGKIMRRVWVHGKFKKAI